ncbi:hypothetical protein J4430_00820 [Candidatus Woesearchaeota archaeon]|nr:hypothetical protein [Candidatus Woesearchaeota archaeon]
MLYYYHHDHLDSTTLTANFNGGLAEETTYYPSGAIYEGGNKRYTYTGKEKDLTGLSYYGSRYYSVDILRRFTQADFLIPVLVNLWVVNVGW